MTTAMPSFLGLLTLDNWWATGLLLFAAPWLHWAMMVEALTHAIVLSLLHVERV